MEERLSEKFATLKELFDDELFMSSLKAKLLSIEKRPRPAAGLRYKRGVWEYLDEHKHFSCASFIELFWTIENRTKYIPAVVRTFVQNLIVDLGASIILHYNESTKKSKV